ncbi:MAG TPA: deaminase, partial [Thermoanaerobaculia bacterium]|nr:deaminase [Thermoanaerobaculia bacterium]
MIADCPPDGRRDVRGVARVPLVVDEPAIDPTDERWMRSALGEAARAEALGEVPIGAVVVRGSEVIGRGHNRREVDRDPLAHAEMVAIAEAARAV